MFDKLFSYFAELIGRVHWSPKNTLTAEEQQYIKGMLKLNYYVVLTRRDNHLSTYFISLGNFLLSGKWSYWAHALMNLEDTVDNDDDFRVVEAIGAGVGYTPIDKVLDVNGIVLLKPKNMPIEYWTLVLDKAKTEVGKPYDTLFDLKNDNALSCVELVRTALQAEPDYTKNFAHFEELIAKINNLTPEMFYDCDDFGVAYEVRHQ